MGVDRTAADVLMVDRTEADVLMVFLRGVPFCVSGGLPGSLPPSEPAASGESLRGAAVIDRGPSGGSRYGVQP